LLFGLFQQKMRQQGAVLAELIGGLLLLAVVLILGWFGAEPFWFAVALALSYCVTLGVTLLAARRLAPIGLRLEPGIWRLLIVDTLPVAATGIITILFFRADVVILSFLQPPAEVGLYGLSAKLIDACMGFTLLLVGLFAPFFGRTARLTPHEFAAHFQNGLTTLTVGAVGIAVALIVSAEEVAVLLGGEPFRGAGTILVLLSVVFVLHSMLVMVREAATALQVQTRLVPGYVVGLLVAMIAYFALIPRFAGFGAALALIITELLILTIALRIVTGTAAHPIHLRSPLWAIAGGVTAAAVGLAMETAGFSWLVRGVTSGTAYLAILLLSRTVSFAEAIAWGRKTIMKKRTF
jgi:O-antigen/teichoic acid export membrane protein